MTLSTQQFQELSLPEQEAYLNSGGQLCGSVELSNPDADISSGQEQKVLGDFPSVAPEPKTEQVESTVGPSHTTETQPVSSFSIEDQKIISSHADGFDIPDPVELLFLLDPDIASGKTKLHDWQAQFMLDFAKDTWSKENPFVSCVRAANGSGKDKYIIAACIVWLCMRYKEACATATNGSGNQLDTQTERSIRYLCNRANLKWAGGKELIWKCNYRKYECIPTQSPIVLFATDEPNKAEGFHPIKEGGRMAIFASEAKAIPDTIFAALTRCTGFTHRVYVSTPGLPMGYFHDKCISSINRRSLKDLIGLPEGSILEYRVAPHQGFLYANLPVPPEVYDCTHITKSEIKAFADDLPGGINDPVYKSGILADFSTTDEQVVIPATFVHWATRIAPTQLRWVMEPLNKAGLDLSDGGAENVLTIRNGNKLLGMEAFRFEDTQDTIDFLEELFEKWNLIDKDATINSDMCGIGKPMIDSLRRRGWSNMRYVDSRHSPRDKKVYTNRGTELFFNMRMLLQNHEIILIDDKLLTKQLIGRYYKLNVNNVRQLLSKLEQRSKGYPSPDRADSLNLCFWDFKSTITYRNYSESAPDEPIEQRPPEKTPSDFSLKEWANSDSTTLASFRRNVAKRKPTTYLEHELKRYVSTMKV